MTRLAFFIAAGIVITSSTGRAAEAPDGETPPALDEIFGGATPDEANRRAAMFDLTMRLPPNVLESIQGVAASDAEVIAANLDQLVNPNNANLWLPFRDLDVLSPGPETSIRRFFNTRDTASREFGRGWTWSFGNRLHRTGDRLTVQDADGGSRRFVQVSQREFRFLAGGQTIRTSDEGYVRTSASDGQVERFDKDGWLVSREDGYGRAVRVKRDARGRVTALVAANGRTIKLKTDGRGRIIEALNPAGERQTWAYEGDLLVASERNGLRTSYRYDAEKRLVSVDLPSAEPLRLSYDHAGWIQEARIGRNVVRAGFTFDRSNPTRHGATLTANGEVTRYEFDEAAGTTRTVHGDGSVEQRRVDPACGCLAQKTVDGQTTRYTYDELGRTTRTDLPDGTSRRIEYGAHTPKKWQEFHADGRLLLTTLYDEGGEVVSFVSVGSGSLHIEREKGLPTAVTSAGVALFRTRYDALGDAVEVGNETRTRIAYDAAGRPREISREHIKTQFKRAPGLRTPRVRLSIQSKGGTRFAELSPSELTYLFGDAAASGPKKASLDDVPGVKFAGPGAAAPRGATRAAKLGDVPGMSSCSKWACEAALENQLAMCLALPLASLVVTPATVAAVALAVSGPAAPISVPLATGIAVAIQCFLAFVQFDWDTGRYKIAIPGADVISSTTMGGVWDVLQALAKSSDGLTKLVAAATEQGLGKLIPAVGYFFVAKESIECVRDWRGRAVTCQ